MTLKRTQKAFNKRFRYKADKGEHWRILKASGAVQGDCEDYALTLIWLNEGRSMLRFWWSLIRRKYAIWQCLSPRGVGHVVLRHGDDWTDNIQGVLVARADLEDVGYRLQFPLPVSVVAFKFLFATVKG